MSLNRVVSIVIIVLIIGGLWLSQGQCADAKGGGGHAGGAGHASSGAHSGSSGAPGERLPSSDPTRGSHTEGFHGFYGFHGNDCKDKE
jgi:hypothetical protein